MKLMIFLKNSEMRQFATFLPGSAIRNVVSYNYQKEKSTYSNYQNPLTVQLQVRVLSASEDAVVKQVITVKNVLCIRPGSSIG